MDSDVLQLLVGRNRCLKRFETCSSGFIPAFESGNLTQLEEFQTQRETILKTLDLFERKIAQAITALTPEARTPALIARARALTDEQTALVHAIMLTDQRITRAIEAEQDRLSLEMNASNRTLETVQRFKSSWVAASGEGLDTSR